MKKNLFIRIISTFVFSLILYYFMLPPINLHAFSFYMYLIMVIAFYLVISIPSLFSNIITSRRGHINFNIKFENKSIKYLFLIVVLIIPVILLVNFILSPVFNSKTYYERININEEGNFEADVKEVDFDHIPLLDKDSSRKLGDRVMGQMTDLVSQFYVSELYTQINYNDEIIRVTPLEYSSMIKYFTNRKEGIPAYITVDSVDGEAKLNRLSKGMKYMPSSLFFENLYRKLRLEYPTLIFGTESFEIDNEGNPYWIVPIIKYTGIGLRRDVNGVIIFNPVDGTSKKYDIKDIPTWVDHVYNADLIIEQVNDWGLYKNGFLNTLFGQKEVVSTTEGYNYTIMNDDVYLYTGITSVVSDESNLGFILTNMRTGNTVYYAVPGAEEYSAMSSAQGQVQDMGYTSTFPLLINLKGKPTYLVSLKDSSGLVKMYGFIDVQDYQKVVVTDASKGIIVAKDNYLKSIKKEVKDDELIKKEITIKSVTTANINGYTYYYITDENNKYKVSITLSDTLPFKKAGDKLTIGYYESSSEVIEVEKLY